MFEITNRSSFKLNLDDKNNRYSLGKDSHRTFRFKRKHNPIMGFSLSTPKKQAILPKLDSIYAKSRPVPILFGHREQRYKGLESPSEFTTVEFGHEKYFRSEKTTFNTTNSNGHQKSSFSSMEVHQILNGQKQRPASRYGSKYFVRSLQGKRPYNEDRYVAISRLAKLKQNQTRVIGFRSQYDYYAVFDGHGGPVCSEFLKDNLHNIISHSKQTIINPETALKESFQKAEQKFMALCQSKPRLERSGSCAVVCLIMKSGIYVANLGDSRALLVNQDDVIEMTKDHKPYDIEEKMRIIRSGGKIYKQHDKGFKTMKIFRQTRTMPGNLNVSRTIGDIEVKVKKYGGLPGMISCQPDVTIHQKQNYDFLLLGSDGLFQAFTSNEIKELYCQICCQLKGESKQKILQTFTDKLTEAAQQHSKDNITVLTVLL